jgi:hypothetical protein
MAAAALVPLGSVANAQSGTDTRPGGSPRPGNQPGSSPEPTPRFLAPAMPSPQPVPDGNAPTTAPPPAETGSPAQAAEVKDRGWVQNFKATELWSGPDEKAVSFGWMPAFSYFKQLGAQEGSRIRVQNPLTSGVAFVTAKDVGPSGAPPEWYLTQKGRLSIPARIIGGANIRSAPTVQDGNVVGHAGHNEGVGVIGEVKGSDGDIWYRIGPNELVHGSLVRVPAKFPPHPGKLIVAELTDPCIVTAYEDGNPVFSTLSLKGTVGWGTPTGFFTILRRVANEIMSSEGLGIPRDAPGGYYLKDVLYTQYFTNDGASIHYNYWSSNWGYSGSHGCLGMSYDDSLWFWEWAEVGTPLVIQE